MSDHVQGSTATDAGKGVFSGRRFIAPNLPTELTITCSGGPVAMLQAAVFDVNDKLLLAVGFLNHGHALSTGQSGTATWTFNTNDAKRGYVKWRITGVSSAAGLQVYDLNIEIKQQRRVVWSSKETRQIPAGQDLDVFEASADIS
jgi:hypothetical protein